MEQEERNFLNGLKKSNVKCMCGQGHDPSESLREAPSLFPLSCCSPGHGLIYGSMTTVFTFVLPPCVSVFQPFVLVLQGYQLVGNHFNGLDLVISINTICSCELISETITFTDTDN